MDFKQHDQPLPRIRRLCFVGPMTGRNSGLVTTQGEILSDMFACAGYPVISVSALRNRYWRLVDIVTTLVRKRKSIDLVMLQVYGGPSFVVEDIASWLGSHLGHRIIMTLHGGAMPSFMGRFPRWSRRVLGRADALIAPSEYLARAVTAYGFRARVIPNIIQLSAYQYRHRQQVRPRMLWMRSFDPDYNPTMAVRVLALLRNRAPDATLVMAGPDGGLEPEVRRLARELGLNGAVHFSGFLDMAQKLVQGDAADIFINTNHIDNMPVAVVEACAMGLSRTSTTDSVASPARSMPRRRARATRSAIASTTCARISTISKACSPTFATRSRAPRTPRIICGSISPIRIAARRGSARDSSGKMSSRNC